MSGKHATEDLSRNVWLQLRFADAKEHYLKAEAVSLLQRAIDSGALSRSVVARRLGMTTREVAQVLYGRLQDVSLERLRLARGIK